MWILGFNGLNPFNFYNLLINFSSIMADHHLLMLYNTMVCILYFFDFVVPFYLGVSMSVAVILF